MEAIRFVRLRTRYARRGIISCGTKHHVVFQFYPTKHRCSGWHGLNSLQLSTIANLSYSYTSTLPQFLWNPVSLNQKIVVFCHCSQYILRLTPFNFNSVVQTSTVQFGSIFKMPSKVSKPEKTWSLYPSFHDGGLRLLQEHLLYFGFH